MLDRYNRTINYLRISVTDRCNLRCTYCMPADGIELMKHEDILSLEEMAEVVKIGASKFGIEKIRLTGGEPLVRKNICALVAQIKSIEGIKEINLTTNGILLKKYAKELKEAGLSRVNISLDSLDASKFKAITRGGNLNDVFEGIQAAKQAGLTPIKINVVKSQNTSEQDLQSLKDFCIKEDLKIQFIREMNLEEGTFSQVEGGVGGNCSICNRLRLTANGNIKPCLFSNEAYNVRALGIEEAFLKALDSKPEKGNSSSSHQFYNIGG